MAVKKYVVTWEDNILAICKSRVDAEEYIFSEVEEMAYEAFLEDVYYDEVIFGDHAIELYVSHMLLDMEHENQWRSTYNHPRPFINLYAFILNTNMFGWYIHEVEEI